MSSKRNASQINKLTFAGVVATLGIVYGDLGTSPLYVMQAIVSAIKVSPETIFGAISCIFWTLTLQTTLKYVIITLRADNHGEGGILALYALLRRSKKKVFIFAIIGASALLADGVITPSISVTSAVEGLLLISDKIPVIPIVLVIILFLFFFQQFGSNVLGKSFGSIMLIWFSMLAILGTIHIWDYPQILLSLSPHYAYNLLVLHPGGFLLLGAVFLCTTGAEALYSDLGHCGAQNIKISWIFVKIALVLNYLGQGAWVLAHSNSLEPNINPFFAIMPSWFVLPGIIISTIAAVIASQALISGSYTLISEAIPLNFWPKVKILYPTNIKGQMYIPFVNWVLLILCIFVILFFQTSANMQAAYGLAITITMLMTTFLMTVHLRYRHRPLFVRIIFMVIYFGIELRFLVSNLNKFSNGGWITLLLTGVITLIMYVWYKGRNIKKQYTQFVKIKDHIEVIKDIKYDEKIPKYATNLVYITKADYATDIESKIIYSIINKQPKRADNYWFIHVHNVDEPRTMQYSVETLVPDVLYRVEFRLGFKINPKINLFFRQAIEELVKSKEVDILSNYPSMRKHNIVGDFRFIIIDRIKTFDFEFTSYNQFIMNLYELFSRIGISDVRALGLDTSNVLEEKVPLIVKNASSVTLDRIAPVVPSID